jgi:predicted transcriptional regulator
VAGSPALERRATCCLDSPTLGFYTVDMEVHFTPEQTAQLSQIAAHEGINTEELVKDAALQLLEADARFRTAVQKAIAQADRGELIDEHEMDARIKRMFES